MKIPGLTLVELLVSLVISAIVLVLVMIGLNWFGVSFRQFSGSMNDQVDQKTWLSSLQREFAHAETIQLFPQKLVIHNSRAKIEYVTSLNLLTRTDTNGNLDSLMIKKPSWSKIEDEKRIRFVLTGEKNEQAIFWEFLFYERLR